MSPQLIWFLVAIAIFILEFAAPGVVLVFFSCGALITSLTTLLGLTPGLNSQLIVFSVSTVVLLFTLRSTIKKWFVGEGDTDSPADEFLGKQVIVVETIPGGSQRGLVEHKGSNWKAVSDDQCLEGEMVEITAIDGLTLTVKSLN